jgi:hypothetical protein
MRKFLMILPVFILLAFAAIPDAYGQAAQRITFKRGARSAVVTGSLYGFKGKKVYVIRVRAGQILKTGQIGSRHPVTIAVLDPKGEIAADSDASCNDRKETEATVAGNYKIIVTECMKADPWRGSFKFRVRVE